jgi:hypothetical protein
VSRRLLGKEEFEEIRADVATRMSAFASRYLAPLSHAISQTECELAGNGAYLDLLGAKYLLTSAHVITDLPPGSLAHLFGRSEDVFRILNPVQRVDWPIDAAVVRIDDAIWNKSRHNAQAVTAQQIATRHAPVDHELLFMLGCSGERARFVALFETLFTRWTPYLTREMELPIGYNQEIQFAIPHKPEQTTTVDGRMGGMPGNPHGFSGSLIWNTRRIERWYAQRPWTPEDAQVTGLVCRWDDQEMCLIATRVEHVRSFLLNALQREAAYGFWLQRGMHYGDPLVDWTQAESTIPHLA